MKPAFVMSLLALGGLTAFGQGTLVFQNIGPGLDAPIINGFTGQKLWGENFKVELMVGRNPNSLTPVATTTLRNSPVEAGYFLGGVVTLDGYPGGAKPFLQVRSWDSNTGATFAAATWSGSSAVFLLQGPLGDPGAVPPIPPTLMFGLSGFLFPPFPEPSTLVFTVVGAAALAFYQLPRRSRRASANQSEDRHQ